MSDTKEQIEFDYVLMEIEVGVDISESNYDILRYYRDEYKDLLAEVERLRKGIIDIANKWEQPSMMRTYNLYGMRWLKELKELIE